MTMVFLLFALLSYGQPWTPPLYSTIFYPRSSGNAGLSIAKILDACHWFNAINFKIVNYATLT